MKNYIFVLLLILSYKASANGLHIAGGVYVNYVDTNSGSKFSLLNDLRLGYRFDYSERNSLALLLITESQEIPNDVKDEKRESLGVSAAFYSGQYYVMGAYFPQSQIEGGGRSGKLDGSGLRVDVGMNFSMSKNIKVGPRLGYRKFSYDQDAFADAGFSSFEPTFAFNIFL